MRTTPKTLHLAAVLLAALLAAAPAMAADIEVSGACTLADAITSANTNSDVGGCVRVGTGISDDIILTADVTLTAALPAVTSSIGIEGNGYTVARDPDEDEFRIFEVDDGDLLLFEVTVTGGVADVGGGIWAHNESALFLDDSTVSGNFAELAGGGIAVEFAYLRATYSKVSDNEVPYFLDPPDYSAGAGIASLGNAFSFLVLTEVSGNGGPDDDPGPFFGGGIATVGGPDFGGTFMLATTVSGNSAFIGGGTTTFFADGAPFGPYGLPIDVGEAAILSTIKDNEAAYGGGSAILSYSTQYASYSEFSGNTAAYVGGAFMNGDSSANNPAEMALVNVTVSGNTAGGDGGGLWNAGNSLATLRNTTFSGNSADGSGGALYQVPDGGIVAYGSLFANSTGGNCANGPVDAGGNLDDDGSCGFITPQLTGADLDPVLAYNGAEQFTGDFPNLMFPRTHALPQGSAAIDAAGDCGLSQDQRRAPRDDGFCDSGAYEFGAIDSDGDGVPDELDMCPETVFPDSDAGVPSVRLGTNRWVLSDEGEPLEFVTKKPKGRGPNRSYTIEDTAGCSCLQIIEELGLGNGHRKFGCSISAMDDWVALVGGPGPI